MLIPDNLTVKELSNECKKNDSCQSCVYQESCFAEPPSRYRFSSTNHENYSKFTKQERDIVLLNKEFDKCFYNKNYNSLVCYFNQDTVRADEGNINSLGIPAYITPNIAECYNSAENSLDIQDFVEWYESNHT